VQVLAGLGGYNEGHASNEYWRWIQMRSFEVRLPHLGRGEELPVRYARGGTGRRNLSPPLQIGALPAGAQSVSFAFVDLDQDDFIQWLVLDIPAGDIRLEEGASGNGMPEGARELPNDAHFVGYAGPEPTPVTGTHRYRLIAYALDVATLDIDGRVSLEEFKQAAEKHAVGSAETYWTFQGR
jgi:Raf kinase inhibitor-like YbhB/YbcL family protein